MYKLFKDKRAVNGEVMEVPSAILLDRSYIPFDLMNNDYRDFLDAWKAGSQLSVDNAGVAYSPEAAAQYGMPLPEET